VLEEEERRVVGLGRLDTPDDAKLKVQGVPIGDATEAKNMTDSHCAPAGGG
jgi:hypothetical protein